MGEDLVGGLKKGIAGLKSTGYGILAGTQGLIGDEEDQEYYLQKAREAELAQAQIVPGYQSSKQAYESEYIDLFNFNNTYWKKYNRTINQMTYLNELKLYDMSLFTMLKRLIPARANADLGVVIEPHFIERSKISPPGRISISGDGSPAPIALTPDQLAKPQQLTTPLVNKPRVKQLGYQLPPQVLEANVGKPQKKPTKISIKQELQNKSIVQLIPQYTVQQRKDIYLVYPSNKYLSAKMTEFIKFIKLQADKINL